MFQPKNQSYPSMMEVFHGGYEVKLLHLAQRYQWNDDTKLSKLVEALEGRALIFFSNLPINVQGSFEAVWKKMNNLFLPKEPPITV